MMSLRKEERNGCSNLEYEIEVKMKENEDRTYDGGEIKMEDEMIMRLNEEF